MRAVFSQELSNLLDELKAFGKGNLNVDVLVRNTTEMLRLTGCLSIPFLVNVFDKYSNKCCNVCCFSNNL